MSKTRRREAIDGYLFIAPWLIGFFLWVAGPMVASVLLSLTEWNLFGSPTWVAFDNFRTLLRDPLVKISLWNTAFYTFLQVPLNLAMALAAALLLNQRIRFREIRDGLSQTFIVGERATKNDYYSTWVGVFPEAEHAPARVVGVSHTPPNADSDHPHNFSSHHPLGANFLSGDGSVRMVSDAIGEEVYHALCTRAAKDSVGDFLADY